VTCIAWRNSEKWATKGDNGLLFLKMIHHFSSSQPRLNLTDHNLSIFGNFEKYKFSEIPKAGEIYP
jgi:hypothetical protein